MRHLSRPFALVLLGFATALAAPAAHAKPAKPPEQPSPVAGSAAQQGAYFESVNVDLINVEVFVTDKSGNPVKGLTQVDFQILEDGHPVTISNFYSVDEDSKPRTPGSLLPLPPNVPRPDGVVMPEAVPEEQKLYLIVYIDNFNIRPFNRNRVFQRLRSFLNDNVDQDDKVMLVTYNRSFKERVSFTTDPALVNSAL